MEFNQFKLLLQQHVKQMLKNRRHLFVTDTDKDYIWQVYLESFPEGANPIFRERREYDCSCCKQFIRSFGNVVAIQNNRPISIWDVQTESPEFQPVVDALSDRAMRSFLFIKLRFHFLAPAKSCISPTLILSFR